MDNLSHILESLRRAARKYSRGNFFDSSKVSMSRETYSLLSSMRQARYEAQRQKHYLENPKKHTERTE